jgi:hypothetical protein
MIVRRQRRIARPLACGMLVGSSGSRQEGASDEAVWRSIQRCCAALHGGVTFYVRACVGVGERRRREGFCSIYNRTLAAAISPRSAVINVDWRPYNNAGLEWSLAVPRLGCVDQTPLHGRVGQVSHRLATPLSAEWQRCCLDSSIECRGIFNRTFGCSSVFQLRCSTLFKKCKGWSVYRSLSASGCLFTSSLISLISETRAANNI